MFFDGIIGQEDAIGTFKRVLKSNHLSHAYIFAGPSGIGKYLFARALAKILMCEYGKSADNSVDNDKPADWEHKNCGQCKSCKQADKNSNPNLRIIEVEKGKQEIAIDTVREIQEELGLVSFYKSYRVFIINDAERLSDEAANSFLKTLEEPVKNTVIILVTSSLGSLLPTVRSRCQVVKFFPLPQELLSGYLVKELKIKKPEADFLCQLSGGSIGDAMKFHKQGMLEQRNLLIDKLVGRDSDIADKIDKYAKANSDDKEQERREILWQLRIIGFFVRDAWMLGSGLDESRIFNRDKIEAARQYQKRMPKEHIVRMIDKILESERYIKYNLNTSLVLERLFIG